MKMRLQSIVVLWCVLQASLAVAATSFTVSPAGKYVALFSPTTNPDVSNSGLLVLTVTGTTCVGKIYCQGAVVPIVAAKVDRSGQLHTQSRSGSMNVDVQFDVATGKSFTGNVSTTDWTAPVQCDREFFTATAPTPLSGPYNFIIGPATPEAPLGQGFVAMTVANNGNVSFTGAMADHDLLVAPTKLWISATGAVPFYASSVKTNEQFQAYAETVLGWLQLTNTGNGVGISGDVLWASSDPTNSFSRTLPVMGSGYSGTAPPAFWPSREKVHIYLLMGQSNMAGYGKLTALDKVPDARVITFGADNFWQPAIDPLHKGHGVGPGLTFGKLMAEKDPSVVIALIPTASDSTGLRLWMPGTRLYENAVSRAQEASRWGTLKGVLWHQGENDALSTAALSYEARLAEMIGQLRTDLNAPNVPFVVGEIGRFIYKRGQFAYASAVNKALDGIPLVVPNTGCVSSKGLTANSDGIHFNAPSQRILGSGYAEVMGAIRN